MATTSCEGRRAAHHRPLNGVEDHFRWPVERRLKSDHGKGDLFQVTWLRWPVHGFTHMDSTTSDVPLEATVGETCGCRRER